jgi:hypothetical protein
VKAFDTPTLFSHYGFFDVECYPHDTIDQLLEKIEREAHFVK